MRLSRVGSLLLGVLWCAMSPAREMHSHPAPEKLGRVNFETSCARGVAADFNRSVALLHSFAYTAAESGFRAVAIADPACALAHWGVAMAYFYQLWSPPGPAELQKGRSEADEAARLNAGTERERELIAAIAAYYHDFEHLPPPVRATAYAQSMGMVAANNPNDTEVQVFYALSLISTASPDDKIHANQKRAASILEPIYREQPDHPGVAHYLIHAYDSTELAPRGLAAARAYSQIAPSAPHALHMPSHIFTRLGLWDDSIASNIAARSAARAQGDVGEELHAMDYLVYAYLQRDRIGEAQRVVASMASMQRLNVDDFKITYAATAMPVRLVMEQGLWEEGTSLHALKDSDPQVEALVFWARAVCSARAGHGTAADEDIAQLDARRQRLVDTANTYWAAQVDVLSKEARAWRSAANARPEEAIGQLQQAADEEDGLEKRPVTPGPIIPAREQLGDLLLSLSRPQAALGAYRAALRDAPGRRRSLAGVAAAARAGDRLGM